MEGGEELNWRDQDIAVCLKLNFVTNVEIIEGEIKEGREQQDSWAETTERDQTSFICLQRALKLSQIRPCAAALPSESSPASFTVQFYFISAEQS